MRKDFTTKTYFPFTTIICQNKLFTSMTVYFSDILENTLFPSFPFTPNYGYKGHKYMLYVCPLPFERLHEYNLTGQWHFPEIYSFSCHVYLSPESEVKPERHDRIMRGKEKHNRLGCYHDSSVSVNGVYIKRFWGLLLSKYLFER